MRLGLPRFGCSAGAGGAFFGTGVRVTHSVVGLAEAAGRPPVSGRNGSSVIGGDPQHVGEPARRLGLSEAEQESSQRDRIAALVAARPIGPFADLDVDLER